MLIIGGPRKGKTQLLAGQVIDHPGAVIVTSTRTDLLDQTAPLRAASGPGVRVQPGRVWASGRRR